MQAFTFHIPVKVIFGRGRIVELGETIPSSIRKILVVTDPGIREKTDITGKIASILKGREVQLFTDIEENPTLETVERGVAFARDIRPGMVIGVGGGSAMDAAKGIARGAGNSPVLACIPTTSGTGSEVTPFAVFTDTNNQTKVGISDESFFPAFSIIDPGLTYSMPQQVILNTGLDSLSHALEAYLSTESFDLNDRLALRSIELVLENLPQAIERNFPAMDAMSYSAMLSGMAITHASTILPHIMGYPLTVYHGVPHGRAGIVMLPALLDYLAEKKACPVKLDVIEMKFKKTGGLRGFLQKLGVSLSLKNYGVKEEELTNFVQKTIVKSDVAITPGEIDEQVILDLYRRSL